MIMSSFVRQPRLTSSILGLREERVGLDRSCPRDGDICKSVYTGPHQEKEEWEDRQFKKRSEQVQSAGES